MATGSYILGATVKIPVQVLLDGQPYLGTTPTIEKIIKPNGTSAAGFPTIASTADAALAMFYYNYVPDVVGDYIVLIKSVIEDVEYITIDNFTVSTLTMRSAPRAEPK